MQSTETKKYNGWTNYETWVTKLWIDNDEEPQNYWCEVTREVWKDEDANIQNATCELSKRLETEIKENAPSGDSGLYADLLNAALSEINWYEIAEAMMSETELDEEAR